MLGRNGAAAPRLAHVTGWVPPRGSCAVGGKSDRLPPHRIGGWESLLSEAARHLREPQRGENLAAPRLGGKG